MTRGQGRRLEQLGRATLLLALLSGVAGCGGDSSTAATTTTAATVARTTDTFTGTVPVGGADFHSFPIVATGEIDVTLTAAVPAAVLGLSVGLPGTTCTALAGASIQATAGSAAQLSGMVSPGTLCVNVFDVGGQSSPVNYTVTVLHP